MEACLTMSPLMRIHGQLFAVSQPAPLLQRQTLADGLARYLGQLGLARRVKVVSINDHTSALPVKKPAASCSSAT